jgi:serine phosphatase RsbU (regulator of sigma subunit)
MLDTSVFATQSNLSTYIESLNYARLIQQGLLPKKRHFDRMFSEYFVIYEPLNLVSGDFYWIGKKEHLSYVVVGDCTGHGVPGAMLSVLARSILEYSIMTKGLVKTHKILQEVDKKFIESFSGNGTELFNNDWIDMALVCIDRNKNKMYFSSAKRKMLHVSEDSCQLIAGDSFPIGGWQLEANRKFKTLELEYKPGDCIYLGSDGFQDQIGGERMKKFSSKQLHNLLYENAQTNMKAQKKLLTSTFNQWKGEADQIDDICLLGIRL